ncbi:MAG: MarR family transcriptional regulator [Magnetococcales bacterium]|nr:MarR family transcriptional regulator [Magnetococcales bacterium]
MKNKITEVRVNSCGWLVKVLSLRMDKDMETELGDHGLNVKHFATLMTLLEQDNLTQTEIAQRVRNPQYVTSRLLDKLEERQLIERRPDPNSRRSHRVVLTDNGRSMKQILPAIVKRVNKKNLSPLDTDERTELIRLLKKLLGFDFSS